MKPFLRWAGSKRSTLSVIQEYWTPRHRRYVEPFAGSASLFFGLQPGDALLADVNGELIRTYREVRRDPSLVIDNLRRLPLGATSYYRIREWEPDVLSDSEAAARFIYLNRYCFNGLYRTNKSGRFNVPYGPPRTPLKGLESLITDASRLLQNAELLKADFAITCNEVRKGDFVYLDPPYAIRSRRVFNEYHAISFSSHDLDRLTHCLRAIDSSGATFVLSYGDSAEARKLAKDWRWRRVFTRRNIAGFTGARRGSFEVIATNA